MSTLVEKLLQWNLPETAQTLVNVILLWIGFAMVVGLVARAFVPSQLVRGPWITFLLGMTGCCLGPLLVSGYCGQEKFNPIGVVGFCVAVIASIIVLIAANFLNFFIRTEKEESDVKKDLLDYQDFTEFRENKKDSK